MVHEENSAQLDIRTVVLVGKQDFGRCPLAARQPTALWPIADRPVLLRLLNHLAQEGVQSVVVFCSDDSAASVKAVCEEAALEVKVLTEDLTKGTAGCLRDAVASDPGDLLVVLSGSMVSPPSMRFLIDAHRANEAMLTTVFNPSPSNGAPCGRPAEIYVCEPAVLQYIPLGGYSDIKEGLIPSILRAGGTVRPAVLPANAGNFHDREGYLDAVALYLEGDDEAGDGIALHDRSDGLVASTGTSSVSIDPTARIFGPVAIGDQAQLQRDALVVGPAVLGRRVVVGPGSAVVGSVLWEGAQVGAQCEIRQSVVARNVVVSDEAEVVEQALADERLPKGSRRTGNASDEGRRIGSVFSRPVVSIGAVIALGLALLWSYWPTLVGLWHVWRGSDEYSAGLLVPFLAIYVIWCRREDFADIRVQPALLAGTIAFILAQAVRSFGLHRMYASAERLSLILSVTALVFLLLGRRFLWKLAPVLLFLCLMLPWPNRVQTKIGLPLQSMATKSAVFCLELIGSDVQRDGNVIRIGDTRVEVATACNGLRMIMAFFIVSGLVVLLARRAWWEKLLVLFSSLPIALLCNTLRLTVTALLFTVFKSETLEQLSHDFGGYAMMPLALAMMVGELWLLARLTTPPVAVTPEVIARRKPRRVPGS